MPFSARCIFFLALAITALLSVNCGGGGGGSSSTSIVPDVNIFPKPELHSRQVSKIEINGETYRYVEEVTTAQAGIFRTMKFSDGMFTSNLQTGYNSVSDNVHVWYEGNDVDAHVYEGLGYRKWLLANELPFSDRLNFGIRVLSSSNTYGPYGLQHDLSSVGQTTLSFQGNTLSVEERLERKQVLDRAGNVLSAYTQKVWFHESRGSLKMEVTEGSSLGLVQTVEDQQLSHDQAFTFGGTNLRKAGHDLVLDFSNLTPMPHSAHLREIYDLGLTLTELPVSPVVPAATIQAMFLYRHHYLYPANLPFLLSEVPSLASYVSGLRASDRFTYYFSATTNQSLQSSGSGASATMGLELGLVGVTSPTGQEIITSVTQVKVVDVAPLSRAYYDGLLVGDIVLAIDDADLIGKSFQEVLSSLPSQEESTVKFLVQRGSQNLTIQTAAEENMAWFLSDGTLYLNVRTFSVQTGLRARSDVDRLEAQQSFSKVILDLRGNGGGRVSGAKDLLDYLGNFDAPSQTTLMYQTTPQLRQHFFGDSMTQNIGVHGKENVVILVDSSSASASELVAGTLKLLGGATIIGGTSFGKGVSQNVYTLLDGTGLWVTNSELLLNGTFSYHGVGIIPDHVVSTTPNLSADPTILAAQSYLSGQLVLAKPALDEGLSSEGKPSDPLLRWVESFGRIR